MDTNEKTKSFYLAVAFSALIFLTRGPLLNPITHIPDATLSIFFIAGIYLRRFYFPALLFLAAGLTDFYAFQKGVSTSCLSPAYPFLIPTYLALWFGGRFFRKLEITSAKSALQLGGVLSIAAFFAFLISSGSFYVLSARFENPTWVEFGGRIVAYFPGYLATSFLYTSLSLMAVQGVVFLQQRLHSGNENPA